MERDHSPPQLLETSSLPSPESSAESLGTPWVPAGLQQQPGCCFQPLRPSRESCRPGLWLQRFPSRLRALLGSFQLFSWLGLEPPLSCLQFWLWVCGASHSLLTVLGTLFPPRSMGCPSSGSASWHRVSPCSHALPRSAASSALGWGGCLEPSTKADPTAAPFFPHHGIPGRLCLQEEQLRTSVCREVWVLGRGTDHPIGGDPFHPSPPYDRSVTLNQHHAKAFCWVMPQIPKTSRAVITALRLPKLQEDLDTALRPMVGLLGLSCAAAELEWMILVPSCAVSEHSSCASQELHTWSLCCPILIHPIWASLLLL